VNHWYWYKIESSPRASYSHFRTSAPCLQQVYQPVLCLMSSCIHFCHNLTDTEYSCFWLLFSCFFSVLATLAFVKHAFSQSSIIVHPRCSKMSDSVLENLMYLRYNIQRYFVTAIHKLIWTNKLAWHKVKLDWRSLWLDNKITEIFCCNKKFYIWAVGLCFVAWLFRFEPIQYSVY